MKKLAAILMLTILAGCQMSRETFDVTHEALAGSPKLRTMTVAECVKDHYGWSEAELALMNTSRSSANRVFCQRLVSSFANGRLTYVDYQAAASGRLTPKMIRIFQGR